MFRAILIRQQSCHHMTWSEFRNPSCSCSECVDSHTSTRLQFWKCLHFFEEHCSDPAAFIYFLTQRNEKAVNIYEAWTQRIVHILGDISELKCLSDVFWRPSLALGLRENLYFEAFDLRIVIRMKMISVLNWSVVGCLRDCNLNTLSTDWIT